MVAPTSASLRVRRDAAWILASGEPLRPAFFSDLFLAIELPMRVQRGGYESSTPLPHP